MTTPPLEPHVLELVRGVLARHARIQTAMLFGSRAKGTHTENSDIDLALTGDVDSLYAESIAAELEELPLACKFDVLALRDTENPDVLAHVARVGIMIYST
jgi:uncharacterized protein